MSLNNTRSWRQICTSNVELWSEDWPDQINSDNFNEISLKGSGDICKANKDFSQCIKYMNLKVIVLKALEVWKILVIY